MRFCFTKEDRLLNHTDFIRLSEYGKKLQNKYFILIFNKNLLVKTRLGITVSKRVGKAITRNRIKRLLREFFRHYHHEIMGTWDINIIAKKEASRLDTGGTFESLKYLFDKISRDFDN